MEKFEKNIIFNNEHLTVAGYSRQTGGNDEPKDVEIEIDLILDIDNIDVTEKYRVDFEDIKTKIEL